MKAKDYRRQVEKELEQESRLDSLAPASARPEWSTLLSTLGDQAKSPEVRQDALRALQAASFLGARFNPARPEFIEALRAAAVDADEDLRSAALDVLANMNDPIAQERLRAGLTGAGPALVPVAVALALLARDDHSAASGIAREVLAREGDRFARAAAARILGADPKARDLLARLMADKDEFREVRRASAAALQTLDRDTFVRESRRILRDPGDFSDIQESVRGALKRAGLRVPEVPVTPAPPAAKRIVNRILDFLGLGTRDRAGRQ